MPDQTPPVQNPPPSDVQTQEWFESLPDDLKTDATIAKYKDKEFVEVPKALKAAQELIGRKGVLLPKENDPDDLNRFMKEIGRPDKADDYKFSEIKIDGMPEIRKENVDAFRKKAHEIGLTNKQADELYKWNVNTNATMLQAAQKQAAEQTTKSREENETKLRTEWGDNYQSNLDRAKKAFTTFIKDPNDQKSFDEKFGNDIVALKLLASIGSKISEDSIAGSGGNAGMSAQEAKSEINKILSDKNNPVHHPMHPEKETVDKRLAELRAIAYGGK